MIDKTLTVQIKRLEVQSAVLKAQVKRLSAPVPSHSFADLYGILSGKVNSSEEEIDSARFRLEWQGKQGR